MFTTAEEWVRIKKKYTQRTTITDTRSNDLNNEINFIYKKAIKI